jgi:two-component system chemotaxis response regulator CheB
MTIRVLVVDDSGFFRRRVTEMLNSDPLLDVVGQAENGEEAIKQVARLKPDVVTMDIEMPVLDGISATKKIMASTPVPIIMFSSLTTDGAKATLDALDAGAVDFLPKRFEDIAKDRDEAKKQLCQRVRDLGSKSRRIRLTPPVSGMTTATSTRADSVSTIPVVRSSGGKVKLVAIGTSTGGPVALQKVLTQIPADFSVPIILIQHMPGSFTPAFAERLDKQCKIKVKEAVDGDMLQPGTAYLAPGGMQMVLSGRGGSLRLNIKESDASMTYKPSVDLAFISVAAVLPRDTLAIVLTGMGADGRDGAKKLKDTGSEIWAQNEASCVVYGMPAAVVEAGLVSKVLDIDKVATEMVKRVG